MKYRIKRMAKGWAVQCYNTKTVFPNDGQAGRVKLWQCIAKWRWRWAAAIHLLWLRERARGAK